MIYNINGVSVTWGVIVKNNVHILLTILFCKYIEAWIIFILLHSLEKATASLSLYIPHILHVVFNEGNLHLSHCCRIIMLASNYDEYIPVTLSHVNVKEKTISQRPCTQMCRVHWLECPFLQGVVFPIVETLKKFNSNYSVRSFSTSEWIFAFSSVVLFL